MTGAALAMTAGLDKVFAAETKQPVTVNNKSGITDTIPETTKLSYLEENLRTLEFTPSSEEWKELEDSVAAIPVVGDRYNTEQQKQVGC